MKISVQIMMEDNSFKIYKFDVLDKILLDIMMQMANQINISIANQLWYVNGKIVDCLFSNWHIDNKYSMFIKKEVITLFITKKNKIIQTPQLSIDMTIKDLRDILSIKDNIYFRNVKLLDNKTFKYYNINDNSNLNITSYINEVI